MTESPVYTIEDAHRYFAVSCNQQVWQILDKGEKTEETYDEIIRLAHSSLWHWSKRPDCKKFNLQRGEYLIALAYTHAGRKEPALYHAEKCQALTNEYITEMEDFDAAYAALAMAGAFRLNDNPAKAAEYLAESQELSKNMTNEADKRIFMTDLQYFKM